MSDSKTVDVNGHKYTFVRRMIGEWCNPYLRAYSKMLLIMDAQGATVPGSLKEADAKVSEAQGVFTDRIFPRVIKEKGNIPTEDLEPLIHEFLMYMAELGKETRDFLQRSPQTTS